MATRTYITAKAPGTLLRGAPYGDWAAGDSDRDNRGQNRFVFLLDPSNVKGGVVTSSTAGNSTTKTNDQKIPMANGDGCAIWVTPCLSAGLTFSGTVTITLKVSIPAGVGAAGALHVFAYSTVGDSLTKRNTLIDNLTEGTAWTSTATWREMTLAISGAALTGDRIVFELGANVSPPTAPPGSNSFTVSWGTTNASQVVQADATNGSTGAGAAWLEFSEAVTFASAASPPANDACADAIVISSLPYSAGPIDTTGSTDTARSVWWTWTAPTSGRVFANTWGGNQSTVLSAFQGTCGGLVVIPTGDTGDSKLPWVGTSQSAIWFEAVEGTTYLFAVASYNQTIGSNAQFAAKDAGGAACFNLYAFATPQTDDLFVSCQHLAVYRDGQLINCQSDFYGDTPTNSCIDYTHRPLDSLNGGTNTALRLYVNLFGFSSPLVEILDLATLNNGEFEIDFIDDPLGYVGHSESPSSIVMDASGRIIIGYFGDNYSVQGGLSTPDQCRPNRLDATHADNQTGAPWAEAERFTIEQQNEGSDYVELSNDQTTLFYTSAGTKIFTYDLNTTTQGPLFATLPTQDPSVPRPGARGLRLLGPEFNGDNGLLVAYGNCVLRVDSTGTVVQTYTPTQTDLAQDLDKVELAADGQSFWVSDQYSTNLFQFNLTSGVQMNRIVTNLPPGQLCGFTVFGYRGFMPPDYGDPADYPVRYLRRSPIISDQEARIFHDRAQFVFQAGIGTTSGQGSDPQCLMRFSDDGGHTWSSEARRAIGEKGVYNARVTYFRLGQTRNRVYEVVVSDPAVPVVLIDLVLDLTKGDN